MQAGPAPGTSHRGSGTSSDQGEVAATTDPLPSWNDTGTRQAIGDRDFMRPWSRPRRKGWTVVSIKRDWATVFGDSPS